MTERPAPGMGRLTVAFTADQVAEMREAVETGEYATTGEIVREAIREWQAERRRRAEARERIGRLWDEGKASGPAEPFDIEQTLAAARARSGRMAAE